MSTSTGFTRYAPLGSPSVTAQPAGPRSLMEVIRGLEGASTEMVERNKTIFFPGDPAERVNWFRRGVVRFSRGTELSFIPISKPTKPRLSPYAVFSLKKKI